VRAVAVLLLVAMAACASSGSLEPPAEPAGTPSSSGCDAWFQIGGPSRLSSITFTLENRSHAPGCDATRVTLLLTRPAYRLNISVETPQGWSVRQVPCGAPDRVCGFVIRDHAVASDPAEDLDH
jgi:hypothetical protein